jgi:hypothetical protein
MSPEAREHSFDELARGLASGSITRGKALRLAGGALLGAALASLPGAALADDDCRRIGRRCRRDSQCCSGNCVRRGDDKVCGCPEGQRRCNDRCVNLKTDERHCGSCSNRCAEGVACVDGVCQGGGGCPSGTTACGTGCVTNCTSGQVLDSSTCTCGCPSGTTACGTGCVTNCTSGQVLDPSTCTCGACTADTTGCCAGYSGNSFCSANASSPGTTCWTSGTCIQPGVTGTPQSCADCGASQACVSLPANFGCTSLLACVTPCAS